MSGWVAGAALVGTVVSSSMQSKSAKNAAESQERATNAATAAQTAQSNRTYEDYAPYREAGKRALTQYETEINGNTTAADALNEPGYQFGLDQGQLGLDRKAAAGGGRVSGASLKAASEYATNYATTGYGAAYQRRQDRMNRLASLAGIGQSATGNSAALGQNAANNISGLMTSQGNAAGAGQIAQGNIWGGAVNQIGAAAQRWAGGSGSNISNSAITNANMSSDPIGSLANSQNWYS